MGAAESEVVCKAATIHSCSPAAAKCSKAGTDLQVKQSASSNPDSIVMAIYPNLTKTNFQAPLLLLLLLILFIEEGDASKTSISCMTCTAKPGQPTWCSRGENKGTVKKCKGDSVNPRNTCFKTVNKKTKEVERGCAPASLNHGFETEMKTGLNGEKDITTYLCIKDYCNSGNMVGPKVAFLLAATVLARNL